MPRMPVQPTGLSADADLLARFADARDEVAFELLVRRHAPMVLAVCRRVLADANDADDAFQATFLVLARKAASVERGRTLAAWLHRVACRAALRIRADRGRRTAREEPSVDRLSTPPLDPGVWELARVLDEEIAKLPERHRVAFVLCCLEGMTGEAAGRLLRCPTGTVSSRLTRARERLRDRLTRRGFAPVLVTAALTTLAAGAGAASAISPLIDSILLAAPDFAVGGISVTPPITRPAAVAEGVIRTMATTKLKVFSLLFVVGVLAAGGVLAATDRDKAEEPNQPRPKAKAEVAEKAPPAPVVRLVRPQVGGLERVASTAGNVVPFEEADLFPTVAGTLKRVEANIGDRVKRDQLLAEIDAPGLVFDERLATVGIEQAKSLLLEAEARAAAARAEIDAAKGVVKQREAEAVAAKANLAYRKKHHDRLKELFNQKAVGQEVLDEAGLQFGAAEAQTEGAITAVENAKADVAVKQSKGLQAEAGVGTAKINIEAAKLGQEKPQFALTRTKIKAPFDGVVTRRSWHPGEYVLPGERVANSPLFTLMRVDTVRVIASVAEHLVPLTEVGVPAEVTFDALQGVCVSGKVARLAFAVDPTNRTMRVEIDVPNANARIRPGMAGTVVLKLGKGPADALRVPVGAVVRLPVKKPGEPNTAVYTYRNGKAHLTPVRVSYSAEQEAEVGSGLTADDVVVVDPKALVPKAEVAVDVERTTLPK